MIRTTTPAMILFVVIAVVIRGTIRAKAVLIRCSVYGSVFEGASAARIRCDAAIASATEHDCSAARYLGPRSAESAQQGTSQA